MIHSGDGHLFGAVSHGHISHLEQQLQIPELAVPADGKEARYIWLTGTPKYIEVSVNFLLSLF